jgi:hypothetical protein
MYSTPSTRAKVWERNVVVEEEQEEQDDRKISRAEWSEVSKRIPKLAGMQGKPGGVGGRVRGRGSDWIGEDGVAPPRHLCFFSSRPVLAQGRGPATQWHVAHSTRACRPAHALPCWLAPSQLFLLPFLHSGPCTQSCSSSHPCSTDDDPHSTAQHEYFL